MAGSQNYFLSYKTYFILTCSALPVGAMVPGNKALIKNKDKDFLELMDQKKGSRSIVESGATGHN